MRIIATTPAYAPRSRVGAWIATHGHLRELTRRGHKVAVRTSQMNDFTPYAVDKVRVSSLGWDGAKAFKGADVVLSHLGDHWSRASECARLVNAPHVVMVHGQVDYATDADLVVFNSQASADAAGWTEPPSIICHPHTSIEDHESRRGGAVTLVNLSQEKGGHVFQQVARALPHHRFLGVKGNYGSQVRIQAAENITVREPQNDMRRVWSQTRILLMPSIAETWGMVGVEAMCSGIPVIAHPTPGLRESLGDAGIFVDRGDVYGWRREIERLDQPHEYALASQKATQRAEELCDGSGPKLFADTIEERFG